MTRLRIAFFLTQFPCVSQTFVLNQITALIDAGHDVQIFAGRGEENGAVIHEDFRKYHLAGKTHYIPLLPGNTLRRLRGALKIFIRQFTKAPAVCLAALNVFKFGKHASSFRLLYYASALLENERAFDIIHCHFGPNGEIAVCLREMGAMTGKIVTTFHGYDIRDGIAQGGQIYSRLKKWGDLVLSISSYNRQHLDHFGFSAEKIRHHPVGIDLKKFGFRNRETWAAPATIRIITVARLVEEKGLEHGIRAVHLLSEKNPRQSIEYLIVGDGPLKTKLQQLIGELGLPCVHFCGAKDQDEIGPLLQQADIFLLPSIHEALPVVLMEAQAVGLPCVGTKVGSVDEVILEGKSGFVVAPANPEALAAKLDYLINHPPCWAEMGRAGREHMASSFDHHKLTAQLQEFYRELIR